MTTPGSHTAPPLQRLCIFLRAPELGKVKTRLAAALGAAAALEAYERLVEHLLRQLNPGPGVLRELWYTGDGANARLQRWSEEWGGRLIEQPPGDLGLRMQRVLAGAGTECEGSAGIASVLVGADCAGLTAAHCEQAWRILRADPEAWVFAPAEDGGFGLVGCRSGMACAASPFEGVNWNAEATLDQCRRNAEREGLMVRLVDPLWDVDNLADWQRFERTFP